MHMKRKTSKFQIRKNQHGNINQKNIKNRELIFNFEVYYTINEKHMRIRKIKI